jgi:hypothetical protein
VGVHYFCFSVRSSRPNEYSRMIWAKWLARLKGTRNQRSCFNCQRCHLKDVMLGGKDSIKYCNLYQSLNWLTTGVNREILCRLVSVLDLMCGGWHIQYTPCRDGIHLDQVRIDVCTHRTITTSTYTIFNHLKNKQYYYCFTNIVLYCIVLYLCI